MLLAGHDPQSIARAAQALAAGQLVGLPTETVYGLAADACNATAVVGIYAAKGRPNDHPLIVHVADASQATVFACQIPEFAKRLMQAFWPGPLTLILQRRAGVADVAAAGHDTVGLRCPSHPVAQAVLVQCAQLGVKGLAAPSANRFGRISPTTAAHVQAELGPELLVVDGGACTVGIESCIVDCTRGAPVVLRPGVLTPAELEAACGCKVLTAQALDSASPKTSGTLESHYAPQAQLRLMDTPALKDAVCLMDQSLQGQSRQGATLAVYSRSKLAATSSAVLTRRMPGQAAAAAQELFAALRDLDSTGVRLIWVETPPPGAEWDGVRDRLTRAAAHR